MDYKQIVIENAWAGVNMDYGLLHAQLGTPIITAILLLLMILALNKLLFQPVLRTLDNRKKEIEESQSTVASTKIKIEQLRQDYDKKLIAAREQVARTFQDIWHDSQKQKEALIIETVRLCEEEQAKGKVALQQEVKVARVSLEALSGKIADQTVSHLLN